MDDVKKERTVPVASRVDVCRLAELDRYWAGEGMYVRSMSQLVSWSIELLREVLITNGMIVERCESVVEAHRYMMDRGLYQQSMKNRVSKKLGQAIAFEGMRAEGIDPKYAAPKQYNIVHRGEKSEVELRLNNRGLDNLVEIYNKIESSERQVVKESMSDEEMRTKMREIEESDKREEQAMREYLDGLQDRSKFERTENE